MYPDIKQLEKILVDQGLIKKTESTAVAKLAHDRDEYVNMLVNRGVLTKKALGAALASSYSMNYLDQPANALEPEVVTKLPESFARKNRIICVKITTNAIYLATDTPISDTRQLHKLLNSGPRFPKALRVYYALPEFIDAAISLYQKTLYTRFAEIIAKSHSVAPEIVDEIIHDAIQYQASDIHFEPVADSVIIRFRVDGTLQEAGRVGRQYYENILNRIKVQSRMRIDEHMSAQDGSLQYSANDQTVDIRVSLVPTVTGEKVVMRLIGSYVQSFSLHDIGLTKSQEEIVLRNAHKPFGMILAVGPTGSGKTTTLYALLKLMNSPNINITTIEDPVEYRFEGVSQIQVHEQANMTFSRGLRAIVRQDPDVILVGEIRDEETAEISVNAALTGHLLLSTFHANNAATAIPRLMDMGIEPFLVASTIELIVAQRLVRKVCGHCRYSMPALEYFDVAEVPSHVKKYFHKADTLYLSKGCNYCNGTGYLGRTGIFEFIELTPALRELIPQKPTMRDIESLAKKEGAQFMFDDGLEKVKAGITTLAELLRVVPVPEPSEAHKAQKVS